MYINGLAFIIHDMMTKSRNKGWGGGEGGSQNMK